MAEGKRSFILYADYQGQFNQLPDDIAGKLIKHLFAYVNDENPVSNDLLLNVAFEPIKNQLKRDLKEWSDKKVKRSEAGKMGGLKSGESRSKQNEANPSNASKNEANEAVNVTDTVNVNVTDTVIKEKGIGDKSPPPKTLDQREELFRLSLTEFVEEFSKETVRAFFDYWTEKNAHGKKMKFEMERTFEIKKRLATWKSKEKTFNQKQPFNDKPKQNTFTKLQSASEEARRLREERRAQPNGNGEEGNYAHYTSAD